MSAQGVGDLDVQLFRSINHQQNVDRDGFFEYLDDTAIPTFGAIPVGFVISGGLTKDGSVLEAGLLSGMAQVASSGSRFFSRN